MNVQFDTCTLTSKEAAGIVSLLSALFPQSGQPASNPTPAASPAASQSGPILVAPAAVPEAASQAAQPSTEPATRHRRTKAQIAADEAAAKAQPTPQAAPVAESTPAAANGAAKPLTAEELRALLNGYIQKHSMEDAIKILQSYECNRVTEALSLPVDKLASLAEALRG